MKRRFTILTAALALLTFLAVPMGMWGQTRETVTDNMTASSLAATGSTYTDFSNVSLTSTAVYAGQSAKDSSGNIQLRSKNSNSGIVSTTSGGSITSIVINVGSGSNTIDVYGSNSAYTSASDLYGNNQGTKLGSLTATGTITVEGNYAYVGVRSNNGAVYISSINFVWTPGPSYTITALSNNDNYGTVSLSGSTITASPATGYRVSTTIPYTVSPEGSATVSQNGNQFNVTPSANTTVTINFEAIPTHTATFSVNGVVASSQTVAEGADITFPADPASINEKVFMGWTDAVIDGTQSTAPEFVTSTTMGSTDVTFYAVFATATAGEPVETKAQTLQYDTWTYGGSTTNKNSYRLFHTDGYVESAAFDLSKLSKVIVYGGTFGGGSYNSLTIGDGTHVWKNVTVSGNSETGVNTYTDGTALTGNGKLYVTSNSGSNSGNVTGVRMSKVEIFVMETPIVYSDYCTTVATDPSVTVTPTTINSPYTGVDEGSVLITYNNLPEDYSFDIEFCDANGDELEGDDPDWIYAEIQGDNVNYTIDANHGEARTAYFKVSASWLVEVGDEVEIESIYSDLVTVNQEAAPEPSITIANATVNVDAAEHDGTLELTYENLPIENMEDFSIQYYDEENNELAPNYDPGWIMVEVAEQDPSIGNGFVVSYYMEENEGEAHTVYFKVYSLDAEAELVYSNLVTISQGEAALPSGDEWVLTDLADLTADDVFVIVGDNGDTYAMSNDNGTSSAPTAVAVTVENEAITSPVAANLQWNISGNATNGYTFYPNGETKTWLYCNNNNNGVRVGTNDNKVFTIEDGYLKNTATSRYIGIYESQDWRCYTLGTVFPQNIVNQTFAFYKKVSADVETYETEIAVYTPNTTTGWHLIASPLAGSVKADNVTNLKSNTYDLYRFDQTQDMEWQNYKKHGFYIESGKGYLYANSGNGEDETVTLTFEGQPYNGDGIVPLTYSTDNENENMHGWNLVGNPFGRVAYISRNFYRMNDAGTEIVVSTTTSVNPMEGIFVKAADANDNSITFSTTAPEGTASNENQNVVLNVIRNRGTVIDRAIVSFNDGAQLPKLTINENSTKLYIPQDDEDYAIVRTEAQGELPVSFRASENGTYTLSMNVENVDMNYLHLIDNMTGMDVDLLQTPSYTFEANTNDYANRFKLVFAANSTDEADESSFAFFSNGNLIVNNEGNATLQVIDINGRILSSETISGSCSKAINATTGVYMLRLINGENVKVQKVVVR